MDGHFPDSPRISPIYRPISFRSTLLFSQHPCWHFCPTNIGHQANLSFVTSMPVPSFSAKVGHLKLESMKGDDKKPHACLTSTLDRQTSSCTLLQVTSLVTTSFELFRVVLMNISVSTALSWIITQRVMVISY